LQKITIKWLMQHQQDDDGDIDNHIPEGPIGKAQSYMEEERAAKVLVIKDLLIKKWATWEEAKKVDQVEQEKACCIMGK
jgi:hypothetical protein